MNFGEKIKDFAQKNCGGIKQLADALGIADTSLHRYINGDVSPSKDFFMKLRVLGCDLNWLLDDKETASATISIICAELENTKKENKEFKLRLDKIKKLLN